MSRKSAHPDLRLFDYLSGALDERAAREVAQHLAVCKDCASVVDVASAMRSEIAARESRSSAISDLKFEFTDRHPDVSELARFFYGRPRAESHATAAHVAICRSCAGELAEHARAERAASSYSPAR